MRVEVYRNLHNGKMSIRDAKTKLVLGHADQVFLHDAFFKVSQAGRARVLREKKKNVHAVVEGILGNANGFASFKGRDLEGHKFKHSIFTDAGTVFDELFSVTYNPYKYDQFWRVDADKAIHHAPLVNIQTTGIQVIGNLR
jgi:hypothetical protein